MFEIMNFFLLSLSTIFTVSENIPQLATTKKNSGIMSPESQGSSAFRALELIKKFLVQPKLCPFAQDNLKRF